MIGFTFNSVRGSFFDRPKVMNAVSRAERTALSRFGAFVRTRARSSIRRRQGISAPGTPPSSHTGALRDGIFFAFDASRKSVVIGPVRLNRGDGRAPQLLESGGTTTVLERGRARRLVYQARPYMRPAFEKELPKMPGLFAGTVKE